MQQEDGLFRGEGLFLGCGGARRGFPVGAQATGRDVRLVTRAAHERALIVVQASRKMNFMMNCSVLLTYI